MKVSFIVIAYKSNDVLPALLQSISVQTGILEKQIIIIDNYSADNCARLVQESGLHASLTINRENRGFTAAVNQALADATGDFVFLLNPDIRLHPDCTPKLTAVLTADPAVAAAAPQLLSPDGKIQSSVRNFPTLSTLIWEHTGLARLFPRSRVFGRWKNRYFDHNTRAQVAQPMASALLFRRATLERIGPWDEQFFIFFSDVDYCKRIADSGSTIIFEPAAHADHRLGGSTRKEGGWIIRDSHRGFYRYLCKHELLGRRRIFRPFVWLLLWISAQIRVYLRIILEATS